MKHLSATLATLLIACATPALAGITDSQTLADLTHGDRVKVRLSAGGKVIRGLVDASKPDELAVQPLDAGEPLLRLTPQQIAKLEVVRGRHGHWKEGAVIGFIPGAVFLTLLSVALDDCYRDCGNTGQHLAAGAVGGAITAGAGALIGLAIRTDRWVSVTPSRKKLALDLAPTRGGFQANLALRF